MASIKEKRKNKYKEIARRIVDGEFYVNRLDTRNELVGLLCFFVGVIVLIAIISIMTGDIYDGIFWSFFWIGILSVFIGVFLFPVYKIICYSTIKKCIEDELGEIEEKDKRTSEHLGTFLSPITRQIMSIGVIPIIFAIIGIILSVEHEIPKIVILKKMINPLILLIILGGVTEAVAFFFGFLFPEPEIPTKAGSKDHDHPGINMEEFNKGVAKLKEIVGSGILDKEGLKKALQELKIDINFTEKQEANAAITENSNKE